MALFAHIPPKLRLLLAAMLLANTASSMYWLFLPLYLENLGASVPEIGFFFTFQVVLAISFRLLGGWLSDAWGRLITIALGGVLGWGALVVLSISPNWYWTLLAASFSELGASLVEPSFQAYTAEKSPPNVLGSVFGLSNALYVISMIAGPLVGGQLIAQYDFRVNLWVATAVFSVAVVLRLWAAWGEGWQLQPINRTALIVDLRKLITLIVTGRLLLWLFLIDGLVDGSTQLVVPFFPKYTTELGGLNEDHYAMLFVWMSLVSMLAMIPAGMFSDRFGERFGIAIGATIYSVVWGVMILEHTTWAFIIAFGMAGLAQAFVMPAISSLVSKSVPQSALGMTWGVFATSLGLLAIPAPYLGGVLYTRFSPQMPFALALVIILLVIPLAVAKLATSAPSSPPEASTN